MSKLRIPLTFALSAVVVLALYAKQKQFLTAVDAAINHNGAGWSIKADRSSVSIPSETRITGVNARAPPSH